MESGKISGLQFFSVIVMFELGGVIALGVGGTAKQDTWIAILFGLIPGLCILLVYGKLYMLYPKEPFTTFVPKILGPYIGKPVVFLYSVHFMYQSVRNFRGIGNVMSIAVYDETPLIALLCLMAIALIYIVYQGIEAMTRTIVTFLIVMVVLGVLGNLFVIFSNIIDVNNMLPLLENGWKTVINSIPLTYFLPYAEMVVVMMFFPYVDTRKPGSVVRIGVMAAIFSGLVLSYTMALNASVLGPDLLSRSTIPLLATTSKINIGDFIQKMDGISISTLVISYFFKAVVYFYVAVMAVTDLWKLKGIQFVVVPLGIIIFFSSIMVAENSVENYIEGYIINPYVAFPFQTAIPIVLLIVALARRKKQSAA